MDKKLALPLVSCLWQQALSLGGGFALAGQRVDQSDHSVSPAGRGDCCRLVKAAVPQGWEGAVLGHTRSRDAPFTTCRGNC